MGFSASWLLPRRWLLQGADPPSTGASIPSSPEPGIARLCRVEGISRVRSCEYRRLYCRRIGAGSIIPIRAAGDSPSVIASHPQTPSCCSLLYLFLHQFTLNPANLSYQAGLTFPRLLRRNLDPDHFDVALGARNHNMAIPEAETDVQFPLVLVTLAVEVQRAAVSMVAPWLLAAIGHGDLQIFQIGCFHPFLPIFASFHREISQNCDIHVSCETFRKTEGLLLRVCRDPPKLDDPTRHSTPPW